MQTWGGPWLELPAKPRAYYDVTSGATYPFGDEELHPLGHSVCKLGEVLRRERLPQLGPLLQ